jgi:anthranilate phosphoribosyltransferase
MNDYLNQVMNRQELSKNEMTIVMENLILGKYSDIQIAGFLVALAIKSTSAQELATASLVMRKNCKKVDLGSEDFVDIVSTGGSGVNTFNVSTAAMFITAGAGVPVAKHGNRSVNAASGSNDVLEMLGLNIHLQPEEIAEIMQKIGICYLFGPLLHPVMKFALPTRRGLGIRTIFNLLEPMVNPAGAKRQLIGVYSREALELMAKAFSLLDDAHVMLVYGHDGMDEITTQCETSVIEVKGSVLKRYTISPEQFGIKRASLEDLRAGDLNDRAEIVRGILAGTRGPKRDLALLNAAAAIYISGRAKDMPEGLRMAMQSIDSGRAKQKMDSLIELTQRV